MIRRRGRYNLGSIDAIGSDGVDDLFASTPPVRPPERAGPPVSTPLHRPHRPLGKLGLDPVQARILRAGLDTFRWPNHLEPPPCDPVRLSLTLWTMGCHASVLARPRYWNVCLREEPWTKEDRANGTTRLTIRWERTKTRAPCRVPVTTEVRPWIEAFLASLPELSGARYERTNEEGESLEPIDLSALPYTRAVNFVGRHAGLPDLVPMAFRHTWFADWLLMTHGNVLFVSGCSGTSPQTVWGYAKRLGFECPEEIADGTWMRRYVA